MYFTTHQINHQVTAHKGWAIADCAGTSQCGADSGQQFSGAEGLREVIVSSRIQRRNLLGLVVSNRQHNDGGVGPFANAANDLSTVTVRQAKIQQDYVGPDGSYLLDALFTVFGLIHGVAVRRKRGGEQGPDGALVVNDENSRRAILARRSPSVVLSP